ASLPLEVQEQLFGVLKAALESTLHPVLAKQTELENRLEGLREAEERAAVATAARLAGPPPRRSVAPPSEVKPSQARSTAPPEPRAAAPVVRASMIST